MSDDWEEDPYDSWGEEPEDLADPSCFECGGQGGWVMRVGSGEEWVWCRCTDES